MTARTDRVDELLREEISDLLMREIADPAVGFVTVTDVETTPDLRHARVWVSVIGQPDDRQASVRALQHAMPFIRAQLGKRLRIKRIPEFAVRLDESAERGSRVLQLLGDIEAGAEPGEPVVGESLPTPIPRFAHEGDAEPDAAAADPAAVAGEGPGARRPRAGGPGGRGTAGVGRDTRGGRDARGGRRAGPGGSGSGRGGKPGSGSRGSRPRGAG